MSKVNWGVLYAEWRCHSIGRSWNDTELDAIYKLKIPVKYVRMWTVTIEEYELIKDLPVKDEETIKREAIENQRKSLIESAEKAKLEAIAKIEAEEAERMKQEAKAKEEVEAKAKAEAEAKAKEEAEAKAEKTTKKATKI